MNRPVRVLLEAAPSFQPKRRRRFRAKPRSTEALNELAQHICSNAGTSDFWSVIAVAEQLLAEPGEVPLFVCWHLIENILMEADYPDTAIDKSIVDDLPPNCREAWGVVDDLWLAAWREHRDEPGGDDDEERRTLEWYLALDNDAMKRVFRQI